MATTTTAIFPNESDTSVVFLMVPFPAQSHLNQCLRLSHLIHSRGFPVHFAASATHCRQVKLRHENSDTHITNNSSGIIFHPLHTPPIPSPPPKSPSSSSSVNFPDHLIPSFEASLNLREPYSALIRELSWSADRTRSRTRRRLVIIHDSLMAYVVQDAASLPNADTYSFQCGSVFFTFCFMCQLTGKPFPLELQPEAIPTMDNCFTPEFIKFFVYHSELERTLVCNKGKLFNTCRSMEGPYINILVETETIIKNQWAISPMFPVRSEGRDKGKTHHHPTLEWLDKQPPRSVIYISFGSSTTMSHEQIKELAFGLEQSKQRFLWVLRDADIGDIFNCTETRILPLPEGYEERVRGVGKVTRDWVPQLGILRHPSVGGFMSHCGWNSCLESLTMGVPLLTWPMHSDQPHNALLVTDILGVGIPVMGWRERNELVTACSVRKSIECLFRSSEGHAIGKRTEDLGEAIRQSVDDVDCELNSFLAYAVNAAK